MSGSYLGNFQLGDTFWFTVDTTNPSTATDIGVSWTEYDILDIENDTKLFEAESLSEFNSGEFTTLQIYVPTTPKVLSVANGFAEGRNYAVVARQATNDSPTSYRVYNFRVDNNYDVNYIRQIETADSALSDGTEEDTLLGRLYNLERNQSEVMFPRLKRILGLLGEHQKVDGYLYDDAGNITECRIRIFDDAANAANASLWDDRQTESDPAASAEAGEIARYTITASHILPRNLRSLYEAAIWSDGPDNDYTGSSFT